MDDPFILMHQGDGECAFTEHYAQVAGYRNWLELYVSDSTRLSLSQLRRKQSLGANSRFVQIQAIIAGKLYWRSEPVSLKIECHTHSNSTCVDAKPKPRTRKTWY